jgi:hypothetical protein
MLTSNKFTERLFYFTSIVQPDTDKNFQYLQKFLKYRKIDNKEQLQSLQREEK